MRSGQKKYELWTATKPKTKQYSEFKLNRIKLNCCKVSSKEDIYKELN